MMKFVEKLLILRSYTSVLLLAGSVFLMLTPTTFAQDENPDEGADDVLLEEVIVTGTRIKRRDYTSPSPLTTISRQEIEFSGQPTLEAYLNTMPQVQPGFDRTANNPGDGTAQIDLRGMGPGRTLVLMNSRRLAPSGVGSAVDVNNLPTVLVDRVEIITGGASTVYGSDALPVWSTSSPATISKALISRVATTSPSRAMRRSGTSTWSMDISLPMVAVISPSTLVCTNVRPCLPPPGSSPVFPGAPIGPRGRFFLTVAGICLLAGYSAHKPIWVMDR